MPRGIRSITGKGRSTRGSARGRRAGSALKGGTKSATRLNEEGKRVRMSTDTGSGVMREVASPTSRRAGAKQQNTPAAKKARKGEGQAAADPNQPAMGTQGATAEAADTKIRSSQVAAKKANEFDKALKIKKDQLAKYEEQVANLSGTAKLKFINKNKQRITALRNSIKDMKSRGGPGGRSKVRGKKISKAGGGQTLKTVNAQKNPGLAKLPTRVRNKMGYAKTGGQVIKKKKGGSISSSMSGKDLVASCYD